MSTPLSFQAKKKTIGDCTYSVEPLGAIEGRKTFVKLSNLLGAAFQSLTLSGEMGNRDAANAIASAIGGFLANLKDEDLAYLEDVFRPKTTVTLPDGKEPLLKDLPNHFAPSSGRFDQYFPWLVHSIDVSFGEAFRGALRASAAQLSAKLVKQSP